MKKITLIFTLALLMALAACGGQEPTPTAVPPTEALPTQVPPTEVPPTEVPPTEPPPTAAPTVEPTPESLLASREHTPDPQLIDITWEWERRDPNGNQMDAIVVPNPENYTLLFNADGTFNAQVDCNSAAGQYATTPPNTIYMELGPMTLAACPPDSLADQMMMMFGPAQSYRFEEDGNVLVLSWVAGGPVDYFRNAAVSAPGEAEIEAIPPDTIELNLQGLADSFSWVVQPGTPVTEGPGNQGMPPHILVTFDGETPEDAVANNGRRLYIFPTQAYIDMYNEAGQSIVADQVTRLQDLIAQAADRTEPPTENMPVLPPPTSFMDRWVQFSDLDFGAGSGVRYVSDSPYRLDAGPWTNDSTGYFYQGLTDNGVFYVSLIWPVASESLPDTAADVPDDVAAEASSPDTYADYIQTTKDTLNALTASDWMPNLADLDALAQSLNFPTELTPSLTGTTWQWVSVTTPVDETAVSDPSRYTITFSEDGTAAIKADCNNVVASYTTDGSSLSIVPGPATLAACPDDSLGDQFV
ncbi:MAG: META domain-containing protein, partial [Anaerolineales bacterium]|nr:META domain-containing protein [Anaerolineales bacterium]